jgi:hypothetical protein
MPFFFSAPGLAFSPLSVILIITISQHFLILMVESKFKLEGNGPLGHPADSEFDTWTVRQFSLQATFSRECLAVHIDGTSAEGTSGSYRDGGRYLAPLPPKQFNVTFELPRREMK